MDLGASDLATGGEALEKAQKVVGDGQAEEGAKQQNRAPDLPQSDLGP